MSVETVTETDCAAGVTPSAPWRIKTVVVLSDYRLAVTFNDGRQGLVDMSAVRTSRNSGIYGMLKDPDLFARARIDLGVITWPNGADLDPAWMYEELMEQAVWNVPL